MRRARSDMHARFMIPARGRARDMPTMIQRAMSRDAKMRAHHCFDIATLFMPRFRVDGVMHDPRASALLLMRIR